MLTINPSRLIATFRQLAAIAGPSRGERPVADYVKSRLAGVCAVEEDNCGAAIGGNAGNLSARVPGRGDPILFAAHLDTVEPCAGVIVEERDGYFVSAGDTILGADDRAAVAVMMELAFAAAEDDDHRPLELLFTVAEEVGLLGANHADLTAFQSRIAYVLDASEPPGHLVTAAPSSELFTATFEGRAAHAGIEPEKGINAIEMAAAAIARMKLGRVDFETTANVGLIRGGRATNIVAPTAEFEGEIRSHDVAKLAAHKTHLTAAVAAAAREFGGSADVKWSEAYAGYRVSEEAEVVRWFKNAAERVGLSAHTVAGGGGSDANVFNARGWQAAVVGCGMEKPHSLQERIAVSSLLQLGKLAAALAARG